ncbi:MAG: diguanylate cyclase [Candidatus Bipolaricaulaceae bacterium]
MREISDADRLQVWVLTAPEEVSTPLIRELRAGGAEVVQLRAANSVASRPPADAVIADPGHPEGAALLERLARAVPRPALFTLGDRHADACPLSSPSGASDSSRLAAVVLRCARARRAERAAHERLAALEASPWVGLYFLDQEMRILWVNPFVERTLGRQAADLAGVPAADVVAPEDRERVRHVLHDKLVGRDHPPYAVRLLHANGTPVWMEVSSHRTTLGGQPAIVGLLRELTGERKRMILQSTFLRLAHDLLAEEEPAAILQRVADAITSRCGFGRAVISLYDLNWPEPLDAPPRAVITSGLSEGERQRLLAAGGMSPIQRRAYFAERFRLGPHANYVPVRDNPFQTDGTGIPGTVEMAGWSPEDLLFIPLRVRERIIGHISVDDPTDPAAPTPEVLEPVVQLATLAALTVERAWEQEIQARHARHLLAIQRAAPRLLEALSEEGVVQRAITLLADELGYPFVGGGLVTGDRLSPVWIRDYGPSQLRQPEWEIRLDEGVLGRAVQAKAPYLAPDVEEDPYYLRRSPHTRASLATPVTVGGEVVAAFEVCSDRPHGLSTLDQDTVAAMAGLCATAIAALRDRHRLVRLYELGHELSRGRTRQELVRKAMYTLQRHCSLDYGAFFAVAPDGLVLEELVVMEDIRLAPQVRPGWQLPAGRGVVPWVAEHRQPALLPDAPADPRYLCAHPEMQSELAVPVLAGDVLMGVLNVESRQAAAFGPEEVGLLQAIAGQLAVALANLAARERLRDQAIRDPLTGLYNRRFLDEAAAKEMARGRRYRRPLAFLFIDVDGFREVNNRLGHHQGDQVLCRLGKFLTERVREADYVFRVGGDEFLVMLPETDGDAESVARRLQEEVGPAFSDLGLLLGLSIGVTIWRPQEPFDLDALLAEADERMYEQKRRIRH